MIGVLLAILGRLLPVPAAARGVGEIAGAISSPVGELMAPSSRRMSQTAWYQDRGPARFRNTSTLKLVLRHIFGNWEKDKGYWCLLLSDEIKDTADQRSLALINAAARIQNTIRAKTKRIATVAETVLLLLAVVFPHFAFSDPRGIWELFALVAIELLLVIAVILCDHVRNKNYMRHLFDENVYRPQYKKQPRQYVLVTPRN